MCTDKNKEGDQFRASVDQDVAGLNGRRIPKGTAVTFVVDHLKRSTNAKENTVFSVVPSSLQLNGASYPLTATVDTVAVKKNGHGLVGALIGAAVAGGVVGGVGGGVVGSHLGNADGCVDKNAFMRITLRSDLTLTGP